MTNSEFLSLLDSLEALDSLTKITVDSGTPPRSAPVADPVKPSYYKYPDPYHYAMTHNLGPVEMNVLKYITRWKQKDGIRDLKKARNSLDRLIAFEEGKLEKPVLC